MVVPVLPLTVTVPADSRHVNHLYARVFIVSASILDDLFITFVVDGGISAQGSLIVLRITGL